MNILVFSFRPVNNKNINGINLDNHVFKEDNAKLIARQLFSAIAYLHENNIIHNDVRPDNLMIEKVRGNFLRIKLIDFGNATKQ